MRSRARWEAAAGAGMLLGGAVRVLNRQRAARSSRTPASAEDRPLDTQAAYQSMVSYATQVMRALKPPNNRFWVTPERVGAAETAVRSFAQRYGPQAATMVGAAVRAAMERLAADERAQLIREMSHPETLGDVTDADLASECAKYDAISAWAADTARQNREREIRRQQGYE